jgi:hypothetical protein
MQFPECSIDLTNDVTYDLVVNKNRDLDQEIIAEIYSGNTFLNTFNFTGWSGATLIVRQNFNSHITILEFSTTDNSIQLGVNGVFKLVKSSSDMQVRSGEYVYNLYLSNTNYPKYAFLRGKFIIQDTI